VDVGFQGAPLAFGKALLCVRFDELANARDRPKSSLPDSYERPIFNPTRKSGPSAFGQCPARAPVIHFLLSQHGSSQSGLSFVQLSLTVHPVGQDAWNVRRSDGYWVAGLADAGPIATRNC
jgi:hypothetical protein